MRNTQKQNGSEKPRMKSKQNKTNRNLNTQDISKLIQFIVLLSFNKTKYHTNY